MNLQKILVVSCYLFLNFFQISHAADYLGDDGNVYTEKGEIQNTFQYKNITPDSLLGSIKKFATEKHSGIQFFVLTPRRDSQGNQGAKQVYKLVFGKKNQLFKYRIERTILSKTQAVNKLVFVKKLLI